MKKQDNKTAQSISDIFNMPGLKIMAPKGVARSRLAICKECEHLSSKLLMCDLCHCIMPAKTALASSRCPDGQWGPFSKPVKPEGLEFPAENKQRIK